MAEPMAETPKHILVVEDEKEIRELMALLLLRQGYKVTECDSVESAINALKTNKISLVVLDWMLPGLSGIDFLNQLQSGSHPSVLMVTARAEAQDIVEGLEKGADDYLTKPFDPTIFLARVKALVRRAKGLQETSSEQKISIGELVVDLDTYEVFVGSEKIHLTPSEYKLLNVMLNHRGKVLTRDQLIENIQGDGVNVIGRTVDTHVFGLRKKLGTWGDHVETIRGIGYRVKLE